MVLLLLWVDLLDLLHQNQAEIVRQEFLQIQLLNLAFQPSMKVSLKGTLTAVASTARTLTGTPDIRVGFVSANTVDAGIALTVNRS